MRSLIALLLAPALVAGLLVGCGDEPTPPGYSAEDLAANDRGVGLMGRFDFAAAVPVFEALTTKHPTWDDVQVNLAIARLNRGNAAETDLKTAAEILEAVLARNPEHARARFCRGILHLNAGATKQALPYFERIAGTNTDDAHAAYFAGHILQYEDQLPEALRWLEEARKRDPSLRSTYYAGFQVLQALGRKEEADAWMDDYKRLETDIQAHLAEIKYTRMGPLALTVPVDPPGASSAPRREGPVFLPPAALELDGGPALRWASGDRALDVSLSAADIDGDGRVDVFAARALGDGERNAVLLRGDGAAWRLDVEHPLASVPGVRAALWGDIDNDGRTDVYLCCAGGNRLFLGAENGAWRDVTDAAKAAGAARPTRDGALVDFDHDGDLDILLLQEDAPLEILVNRLDGTFMPLPKEARLPLAGRPCTGLVLGDFDRDRDLDLLLLHGEGGHEVLVNDRLWGWHLGGEAFEDLVRAPAEAGLALDSNADGQVEVVLASAETLTRWVPDAEGRWRSVFLGALPEVDGKGGVPWPSQLGVLDADGDGALEVLWQRAGQWQVRRLRDGSLVQASAATTLGLGARPVLHDATSGMALVGFAPGRGPVAWRPGPGRHAFAALDFSGRHQLSDQMRSNASGVGVRASARIAGRWTVRWTYRAHTGPGQDLQPLALGLGGARRIDYVDLLWSDGLAQTETLLEPGQIHRVEETQRQTSSCPVLFVWDGARYAFVTDLLGVGGIGFWVAPDTYAPPAPQESVLLPEGLLQPKDGALVLKLGEPMEEACYLDGAWLDVVDLPPGWQLTVDERMAVEGPAATGAVVTYRELRTPAAASDQDGRDVLAALAEADLRAVDCAKRDRRFIGRTAEQVLTLHFDKPLDDGPGRPVLLTDGWIEYPYAQTLFAAWQADAAYEAPTVEARGKDGTWKTLLRQYGYPAGMPRASSVPLPDLPKGTRALRLRTTQEVYWDRVAVAYAEPCAQARRATLGLQNATLLSTGFAKRTTGPQRLPHYDYAERAPLWDTRHQRGLYTAFGDVRPLVEQTDDAVVIFGPGEEVELRFAPPSASLPEGWTRRYVLRTTGWCKDMDLFTKDGETLGPLPRRDESRPPSPERDALHAKFNTRYRSGR